MTNAINWFELPVNDMDRARAFYGQVLSQELQPMQMGDREMAFFAAENNGVGGCLIKAEGVSPMADGSLIYLNGGDDLAEPLNRIESAGGKVVMPKTSIGENGFIAMFLDTEGNKVALHSMS